MAKPIRRTPVLKGEDAKCFVKRMIATENRVNRGRLTDVEKEAIEMFSIKK